MWDCRDLWLMKSTADVFFQAASGGLLPGWGAVLPTQEKPQLAEVIAVGPGTEDTKMVVKVGDKVVYSKYAGSEIKIDNKEVVIIRQTDILAIVE